MPRSFRLEFKVCGEGHQKRSTFEELRFDDGDFLNHHDAFPSSSQRRPGFREKRATSNPSQPAETPASAGGDAWLQTSSRSIAWASAT
ncbi:MAG: hypothetical protein EOP84_34860 [Verrucomicrobiaceae bacterium]|nr:MAG: hypothetical protein EOP84_34860 [Verrucomicrobiaceae bacterium]